jgi:Holliday junction DNA helicase RuvA
MYEFIKGEIAELTPTYAVVEAGGVGYYLVISLNTYTELQGRPQVLVYVHFVVREDAQVLYGFASREERELFRQLIGVSGVGGNTARMVLSTYAPRELSNIIATGNDTLLRNVKGLGLKTAQKIIVELKDKVIGVGAGAGVPATVSGAYDEALAALTMLGFARAASGKAIDAILRENPSASIEEVVRLALKKL